MEREEFLLRSTAIVVLGAILMASVIGLTIVSIFTDRDVWKAEALTFGGVIVLAAFAGVTLRHFRHHRRWKIERENGSGPE